MRWDVVTGLFRVYELGGGGGPTSSTSVQQNFSPEEAAKRAQVMDEAARIYNSTKGTISNSPYPGSVPVMPSADNVAAKNYYESVAPQIRDFTGQQVNFSNFLQGDALKTSTNPYLQDAISTAIRPIQQSYTDSNGVFSQIRTGATGSGQYGSSRQGIAEGIAGRGYLTAVGDVSTNMSYKNYSDAQDRALKAEALAPSIAQMGLVPGQLLEHIGDKTEQYQQSLNDYTANSKMWDLNAPWAPLQNYANIVFGGSVPSTTSSSQTTPSTGQRVSGAIGAAAAGATIGNAIPGVGTGIGAGIGLLMSLL